MRRVRWKVDFFILPMLSIIFFLAAMDRTDIGNVQVAGMEKHIHATPKQWADVVSLFYIGYVLCQPIGVLLLRPLTPPVTIGFGILFWGALTMVLVTAENWSQAVAIRVFIGAGESFIHAASLYISLWYGPTELASRAAIYFSTSTLAGAFNGLIAYGVVKNIGNKHPFQGWQWVLFIEGLVSVGFSLIVFVLLPPVPEKAGRLHFTDDERRLCVVRTWQANNTPNAKFKWSEIPFSIKDPSLYTYTIMFSCNQIALSSLSSFLPATIKSLGYSSVDAQLMSVPVYACAFVTTIGFGFASDRWRRRGYWVAFSSSISLLGYVLVIANTHRTRLRYAGLCIAAAGQFPCTALILSWNAFNTRAYTHRVTAGTIIPTVAQAAALGGLQAFDTPPYYIKGDIVVLAMVALMIPVALVTSWHFARQNRKKEEMADSVRSQEERQKSLEELGSKHPDFRYTA
ncbi:MFS general substrate transporter [Rhizodiscina lignyota]|uniref:MFS general substrate transporter n=1 Tax=Rhizodiscina lignyota TaxID=1504668 RepID=A0A9P4M629_9PEZI|nr:MFS general substrate transporter [Rhizodiscina lignyota]